MNETKKKRLLNTRSVAAAIMLTDKDFELWLSLRWEMINEWHKDNSKEVLPCMDGSHSFEGKTFTL